MPILKESDYDAMAKKVVSRFLSREAGLADAAADEAREQKLNPDQIERMTQASNTEAFLRMMDQKKQEGGQDLTQEFEPIDSRQVIKIVIDQNGVHVDGPHPMSGHQDAPPMSDEIPDEMGAEQPPLPEESPMEAEAPEENDGPFPAAKSKKKELPAKKSKKAPAEKNEKEASFNQSFAVAERMRKLAAHLQDLRLQTDVAFEERFDKLASCFRGLYKAAEFEEFEKSALSEYGDDLGIALIQGLRTSCRYPEMSDAEATTKVAALLDRHIATPTRELQIFGDLLTLAKTAQRLEKGVEWIRCKI